MRIAQSRCNTNYGAKRPVKTIANCELCEVGDATPATQSFVMDARRNSLSRLTSDRFVTTAKHKHSRAWSISRTNTWPVSLTDPRQVRCKAFRIRQTSYTLKVSQATVKLILGECQPLAACVALVIWYRFRQPYRIEVIACR